MTTESDEARAARWRGHAKPLPAARAEIPCARRFSASEHAKLKRGVTPREMEDKWVVFVDRDVLRFVRSWTGYCVFEVPLTTLPDGGAQAEHAWANRDGPVWW